MTTTTLTGRLLPASFARRPSPSAGLRELHGDERGAVMLIGLCMACFLIGSLWFLIGIGDAIVFRDSMQEVADHAAFTSAVLNAKGMNFISACNLVMLAFVFFHILLGMVNDILFLACAFIPGVDIVACPAFVDAHQTYTAYAKDVMKPAVTGLHYAELVAGYAYPWLGSLKGYTLGGDYAGMGVQKRELNVLVLSPSMIPGTALDKVLNTAFTKLPLLQRAGGNQKLGLPVQAVANYSVCGKVARIGTNALLGFLNDVPFIDKVFSLIKGAIALGVEYRYCNSLGYNGTYSDLTKGRPDIAGQIDKVNSKIDALNAKAGDTTKNPIGKVNTGEGLLSDLDPALDQWWGQQGPLYPWSGTANGSPWNEVWSMVVNPAYSDKQEHAVALGQRKLGQASTAQPDSTYMAESEFYFDCKASWGQDSCDADDNAAYSVQWRARLRRLEKPAIGTLLGSYLGSYVANLNVIGNLVRDAKGNVGPLKLGSIPIGKLGARVIDGINSKVQSEGPKVGGEIGSAADPASGGAFH